MQVSSRAPALVRLLMHNVFARVQLANLTLNIRKCEFANATLDFLGHTLSLNTVRPRKQRVDALLNFPTPTNWKQVQSLLGLAGYYGKFLPHCADITLPLTKLLKKNTQFKWSDAADATCLNLKSRHASRPYSNHTIMTSHSVWLLILQITVWEQYCFRSLMDRNTRFATSAASSGHLNSTTPQLRKKRWLSLQPSARSPFTLELRWSRYTLTVVLSNTSKRCRI